MNRILTAGVAVLAASGVPGASAADVSASDTIVVTATRNETPLDETLVPVRVITRDDIELSMATDLAELLRFEAGMEIGRNGGPGQATSIFLRGTESNHTLVLVDGVRINPGTIGGAAVQHVSPDVIERIEIVKGARSSLFGTDAIGGVVNIITRDADESFVEAAAGGGSFDTRNAHFSGGVAGDAGRLAATVSWQDTDGYAPRTDSPIERGYDNATVNLAASREFGDTDVSLRHWRAAGNVEYLDFFLNPVDQDFGNSATALQVDTPWSRAGSSKLIVSHIVDEIRQRQSPDYVESTRTSLDWQYSHAYEHHTLTGGLYYFDEDAQALSFGTGFDENTTVRAIFVQDQISAGRHRAFLALRLTDHETFGNRTTWNAEYGFDLTRDLTFTAGVGRAFRAPDATDRYGFGGNPALDPEVADNAQLGLRYRPASRHSVDLEFYASDLDQLIEFDLETFSLVNIDKAEIRGVELGYEYRGEDFSLRTEFVRQSAEDATTGARLLRRAERSATLRYTQNIGAHRIALNVLASDDRAGFGDVELDGYVVASLSGQFRLSDTWQLVARVENLFDAAYETAADFRMQERSGFIELRYDWK